MEINSYLLRERIDLGNLATGVIGTAAATVDIVSDIGIAQTTANAVLTLPAPTDPRNGRSVSVANSGTVPFTMQGISIGPGNFSTFEFHGNTWRTHVGLAGSDFWRDTTVARALPDGTTDVSEGIVHNGPVHMGANQQNGASIEGFHHEAIVSYTGNGYFQTQVIQTTIPANSTIMPAIFIKGYVYGTADTIDLQMSAYTYNAPANTTINHVWVSNGSKSPTQIRFGYEGGFLAIELTWPIAEYFNRYEVSAFCDGNGNSPATFFQGWTVANAVLSGAVVSPTVVTRKYPQVLPQRNLQNNFTSQATTKISLAGEIRWDGFYHIMTRGTNSVEPNGHFRIDMPADAFAVPVAGGGTRAVVPAVAGSSVDTGGILLNAWESLYYKHPKAQGAGSVSANFLIVPYLANTQTNSVFTEADDWIMIARRDNASVFTLGTGDVTGIGGQVGRGGFISTANWQAMKQRVMGDGYFFVPAGNAANNLAFGFTGVIRWIDGGSTPEVNSAGYVDAGQVDKAAGRAVRGTNGAANRTWRLMTAAEKPGWFGGAQRGVNPILAASTTVVDLNDNETLYYVRNMNDAAGQGEWVVAGYAGFVSTPIHWLPIASKQTTGGHSTTQVLLGGVQYALKAGDARFTSTNDAAIDAIRRNQNIIHKGLKYCRFALAAQFAGAGANGLLGSASGIYSSWDDNTLIYGISDGYSNFGNQYTWLNPPTNGAQIPVVSTGSNVTRVVKAIGGRRYIPLGVWEALFWIPPAYTSGTTSVDGDWVISYYGSGNQHLPPSAVMVLKYEGAVSSASGTGIQKTRIKFADGTYMQPGYTYPPSLATEFEYDHAQGSGDWRPITVAGGTVAARTSPGMTAPMAAVAGVVGNYGAPFSAFFRYLPNDSDPRGQIEIEGLIALNGDVANGAVIAFMPGVFVRGNPIQMAQLTASTFADAKNIPVQVRYTNVTINGQTGSQIVASAGFTGAGNPYRTLGANGGASAAGANAWLSLGPLTLPHA
jgi:hypothetical protein